jgi:hypothetical protein
LVWPAIEALADGIEQAVALTNEAVEIRERRNIGGSLRRIISDDGQPQT